MDVRQFFIRKAIGSIVIVVVLVGGFFLSNNYFNQENQGDDVFVEPSRAFLEGEYVCLPYKDATEITTEEVECEPGIRTNAGEYYAVNFFLMSQTQTPLEKGQRFSAKGAVTPIERLGTNQWQKYEVMGIFSVTDSVILLGDGVESYACPADAKLCPDGSYVGRDGSQCEFKKCPSLVAEPVEVVATLGDNVTVMNLTISPQEIVSDSRCPAEVECVWAGTVEVRTNLETQVSHGEPVLVLGEAQVFDNYSITLVGVTPKKTQAVIPEESYEFTYSVSLK